MNAKELAAIPFFVSGLATFICWCTASFLKSKRWVVWTIIFAALNGFCACAMLEVGQPLSLEFWGLSVGMAIVAGAGMFLTIWWLEYLRTSAERDIERRRSALRLRRRQLISQTLSSRRPTKTAMAAIGLAGVIGWLFWQKRRGFHKSKEHTES